MKHMIVNKDYFKGVFPHKGARCVKSVVQGMTSWHPTKGRRLVFCTQQATSDGYLPKRVCGPHPKEADWRGLEGSELVWVHKCPDGVLLTDEYQGTVHDGASTYRFTLPKGSRVYAGRTGRPEFAGSWWVEAPDPECPANWTHEFNDETEKT